MAGSLLIRAKQIFVLFWNPIPWRQQECQRTTKNGIAAAKGSDYKLMIKFTWNTRGKPFGAIPIQFFTLPYSLSCYGLEMKQHEPKWDLDVDPDFTGWLTVRITAMLTNSHSDFALGGLQRQLLDPRKQILSLLSAKHFKVSFFKEPWS